MTSKDQITRIRIVYSKKGMLRFNGHLDMQRLWERALRRASLPVRYSQGFHPKARLNLASALPLGYISRCEVLDFWLDQPLALDQIQNSLTYTLPTDLQILDLSQVPNDLPALQTLVTASEYQVHFFQAPDTIELTQKATHLLSQTEILHTKRNKTYNLRETLEHLEVINLDDQPALFMRMSSRPGATGRPDEIITYLGYDPHACLIERIKLIYREALFE